MDNFEDIIKTMVEQIVDKRESETPLPGEHQILLRSPYVPRSNIEVKVKVKSTVKNKSKITVMAYIALAYSQLFLHAFW